MSILSDSPDPKGPRPACDATLTTARDVVETAALSPWARRFVVSTLMLSVFMSALDGMVMTTASRTIADSLQGLTNLAWITTSYLLAQTLSSLFYGKLSDLFGRRRLLLVAIALFSLGTLLCAGAQSVFMLSAFRAIQGLGAGGLGSLVYAALSDLYPPRERVRQQSNVAIMYGVASFSGPILGGPLAGAESILGVEGWRWIFLINIPLGIVGLLVIGRYFHLSPPHGNRKLDVVGGVTLTAGLLPLLLFAQHGGDWGWSSTVTVTLASVGLLGVASFVIAERRAGADALLPPKMFLSIDFSRASVVNLLGGAGAYTALMLIPLHLQIVKGLSPTTAGLLLLPQSFSTLLGAKLCGWVGLASRTQRRLLVTGLAILSASYGLLATAGPATSVALTAVVVSAMGLGLGLLMQSILTLMQDSAPQGSRGVASGFYGFTRQIGGIVGLSTILPALFALVPGRVHRAFSGEAGAAALSAATDPRLADDPANGEALASLFAGMSGVDLNDTSALTRLDPAIATVIIEGFSDALSMMFVVLALLLLAAVCIALIPHRGRATR